jgi:uncharacterized membrane protein
MDLVYFFAVATWVLSGNEAPKGPPAPDVPANLGYTAIFIFFFLLIGTFVVFCIRNSVNKPLPPLEVAAAVIMVIACCTGMYYGYEYHVDFLRGWYSTH